MSDKYKKKIILSLSDFLPPLVESIMKLLEYVKKEEVHYNEDLIYKLEEITYLKSKLLDSIRDDVKEIKAKKLNELTEFDKKYIEIFSDYFGAFDKIDKGVLAFFYLFICNWDLHEQVKDREWYKSIVAQDVSVEEAVDSLYEGSKMLVNIIDAIID